MKMNESKADLLVQLGTLLIREQTRDKFKMRFFCKANIGQLYLRIFEMRFFDKFGASPQNIGCVRLPPPPAETLTGSPTCMR